jgi:hypothetical protein
MFSAKLPIHCHLWPLHSQSIRYDILADPTEDSELTKRILVIKVIGQAIQTQQMLITEALSLQLPGADTPNLDSTVCCVYAVCVLVVT